MIRVRSPSHREPQSLLQGNPGRIARMFLAQCSKPKARAAAYSSPIFYPLRRERLNSPSLFPSPILCILVFEIAPLSVGLIRASANSARSRRPDKDQGTQAVNRT